MASADDEKRITGEPIKLSEREWKTPTWVELDGPGPFLLPLCGMTVSALTGAPGQFVLELETAKLHQRVRIPISAEALPALRDMMLVLANQDQPKGHTTN